MGFVFNLSIQVLTIAVIFSSTTARNVDSQLSLFGRNNAKFSTDIYSALARIDRVTNFVISPFSIQTAGAMLYAGASGQTAEVMAKHLRLGMNNKMEVGKSFQTVLQEHRKESVEIANKIYLAEGLRVKTKFEKILTKEFYSEEENVNFSRSSKSVKAINDWVKQATHNKIKELVKDSSLDKDTLMFLVNVVFFKGLWKEPFTSKMKGTFVVNGNDERKVDMMSRMGPFKYGVNEELNSEILELEYKNTDISMMILLPKEMNGLQKLEANLPEVDLLRISENLYRTRLEVSLPKFTIELETDLRELLTKLGMGSIFSHRADFSNMIAEQNVEVNKAIHKVIIEVNELGTEAGAVTGLGVLPTAMYPSFNANHPFVFIVKSKTAVLFIGRYMG